MSFSQLQEVARSSHRAPGPGPYKPGPVFYPEAAETDGGFFNRFSRRCVMRKIEAVIRPDKLDSVQEALRTVGYPGVMVTQLVGHGRQHGGQDQWPLELRETFLPKLKLEIIVAAAHQEKVVEAVVKAARTGEPGDGKIFISDIRDAIRVRTGERGNSIVALVPPKVESPGKSPKSSRRRGR